LQKLDNTSIDFLCVMECIEESTTQKELAQEVGFSVGKINYIVKALVEKGYVKIENFVKSNNKRAYGYLLTKEGLLRKIELTEKYISIKQQEYETLNNSLKRDKNKIKEIL